MDCCSFLQRAVLDPQVTTSTLRLVPLSPVLDIAVRAITDKQEQKRTTTFQASSEVGPLSGDV
jgi:hypothetical protein